MYNLKIKKTNILIIDLIYSTIIIFFISVLHCLRERFGKDLFYTQAGMTVVALNPFKEVPELYDNKQIVLYHENQDTEGVQVRQLALS